MSGFGFFFWWLREAESSLAHSFCRRRCKVINSASGRSSSPTCLQQLYRAFRR